MVFFVLLGLFFDEPRHGAFNANTHEDSLPWCCVWWGTIWLKEPNRAVRLTFYEGGYFWAVNFATGLCVFLFGGFQVLFVCTCWDSASGVGGCCLVGQNSYYDVRCTVTLGLFGPFPSVYRDMHHFWGWVTTFYVVYVGALHFRFCFLGWVLQTSWKQRFAYDI